MNAAGYLRVACLLLSTASAIGAGAAFRVHQPYLASRLIGLSGAAVFATATAEHIVDVARSQPRTTFAVVLVLGVLGLSLLALVLIPDRIFRILAWAAGNPRVRDPF